MAKTRDDLVATSGLLKGLHTGMGVAAKGMVAAFVVFTVLNVEFANSVYSAIRGWVQASLSWYYIIIVMGMVLLCIMLMFSRHGSIRLGDDDSRPEFSNFSWFAMLFSAGVGIGILFFGVAEPAFYFDNSGAFGYPNNPHADIAGATAMDMNRAVHAMRVTYFHWGFHGWAIYVVTGLCLAYFGFRKKLPLTMRSALYPVIGDKIYGPIGHGVDLLAVFGTIFGVATSLGLGVKPDGNRTERAVWDRSGHIDANHPDRCHLDHRDDFGGQRRRKRHSHHFRMEHLALCRPARVLPVLRSFPVADGLLRDLHWRLSLERDPDGLLDSRNQRRDRLARRLDDLLLGLVDFLGALRRHVHRTHQPRPDNPRIHDRRHVRAHDDRLLLAVHVRWQRHLHGAHG